MHGRNLGEQFSFAKILVRLCIGVAGLVINQTAPKSHFPSSVEQTSLGTSIV
jgi:hypothetical protein